MRDNIRILITDYKKLQGIDTGNNLHKSVAYCIGYADAGWEAVICLPVTLPDKTGHAIPECKKF